RSGRTRRGRRPARAPGRGSSALPRAAARYGRCQSLEELLLVTSHGPKLLQGGLGDLVAPRGVLSGLPERPGVPPPEVEEAPQHHEGQAAQPARDDERQLLEDGTGVGGALP